VCDVFDFFGGLSPVALHLPLLNFWIPVPSLVEEYYQYIYSSLNSEDSERKNIDIV
jgi:hypothetical protein